ncbi:hypothetical protein Kisp02_55160 [Kineosporia sp. NBRC 101731]|nr:hypothetical protein Kisp02_55160 [Kineosporia sp. NBRC 101731]
MDPSVIRQECGPATAGMVIMLMAHGWRVRRQGHRFRLYCPCGEASLPYSGASHDDVSHAARIVRQAAHCG